MTELPESYLWMEPFRMKAVEPIRWTTRDQRQAFLSKAEFNLYRLDAEHVVIDLLTDSGLCAMSATQWSALMQGDESYAGSASFKRFESIVHEIFGFDFILPTHQGRAAERLMIQSLCREGDSVPANAHFDTTRANLRAFHMEPVDLPSPKFWEFAAPHPFKGNIDTVALERLLRNAAQRVPFVLITLTNNSCGDQPISMHNLREVRRIASEYGVSVYFDACRFAQNAWFIRQRESEYRHMSVRDIVREMFSYADGCIFSAKKDALAHTGGFFATRSEKVAQDAGELLLLSEGYLTYGGITGRDLETIAVGLREVLDEDYLRYRIETTAYLAARLNDAGIPILRPAGGHAVYIDASTLLPHLKSEENPGQALAVEIYLEGGVRSTRLVVQSSPESGWMDRAELVRLALPSRVYSKSHLDYVACVVQRVAKRAKDISGLRTVSSPLLLGGFTARYEWQEQQQAQET